MKVIIDNVFFHFRNFKILNFFCMSWNHNYNPLENQLDFFWVKLLLDRHRKFWYRIRISPQYWPQITFDRSLEVTSSFPGSWDRPEGPESDPDIRRSLYRWCHYTCDNWSQDFINVHIVLMSSLMSCSCWFKVSFLLYSSMLNF